MRPVSEDEDDGERSLRLRRTRPEKAREDGDRDLLRLVLRRRRSCRERGDASSAADDASREGRDEGVDAASRRAEEDGEREHRPAEGYGRWTQHLGFDL